jgi:hypothetical protein
VWLKHVLTMPQMSFDSAGVVGFVLIDGLHISEFSGALPVQHGPPTSSRFNIQAVNLGSHRQLELNRRRFDKSLSHTRSIYDRIPSDAAMGESLPATKEIDALRLINWALTAK